MTQTQRNGITLAALAAVALGAGTYWMAGSQAETTVKVVGQDQLRRIRTPVEAPDTGRRPNLKRDQEADTPRIRRVIDQRKGSTIDRRKLKRPGIKVKRKEKSPAA